MSDWLSAGSSAALLLAAGLAACRAAAEAPEEAGGDPEEGSGVLERISGWTRSELRLRESGGDHDADLDQTVFADLGDPATDAVTAHVMGIARADLDGTPSNADGDFPFTSLADTFDSPLSGQLFHGYVSAHDLPHIESLQLGRQLLYETPEIAWFDGASAETHELGELRLRLGAFGGRQAIPYESSGEGDALGGAWVEARPWRGGRVRADWMHAAEHTALGAAVDDLFAGGVWQQIDEHLHADAQYSRVSGRSRDVRIAARWYDAARELGLNISYYRLLAKQQHLAVPLDPFFSTLQELQPYFEIRAGLAKSFGDGLHLDLGVGTRRVAEVQDIGAFNRDFRRQYAIAVLPRLLPHELELTVTGERFHADGSDVDAASADISREFEGGWRTELGTHYALYEFDPFDGVEREDVRTWYVRVREDPSAPRALDLRYEYERGDTEEYHQVRVGMTWRF